MSCLLLGSACDLGVVLFRLEGTWAAVFVYGFACALMVAGVISLALGLRGKAQDPLSGPGGNDAR